MKLERFESIYQHVKENFQSSKIAYCQVYAEYISSEDDYHTMSKISDPASMRKSIFRGMLAILALIHDRKT